MWVEEKIVLGAMYVRPNSKNKTATLDHISEVYNLLNTKYGKGTFWILAGDTNTLKNNCNYLTTFFQICYL